VNLIGKREQPNLVAMSQCHVTEHQHGIQGMVQETQIGRFIGHHAAAVEQENHSLALFRLKLLDRQLLGLQFFFARGMACCFFLLMFIFCPYLNEIILLERNFLSGSLRRIHNLHYPSLGLLFGRLLGAMLLGIMVLVPCIWFSLISLRNMFVDRWDWASLGYTLGLVFELPLAIWMTVGLFTVVRFLSYLDLRIRREGWEVELQLRAEAAHLNKRWTH